MNPVLNEAEIQRTLAAYRAGKAKPVGILAPDVAKAWNVGVGFQAYNLQPVALLMFPQLTPIRNFTARVQGKGRRAEYKAVTALNTVGLAGWVAEGNAAPVVTTATIDRTATYRSFALGDSVTFESQWAGYGFTDVKALAVTNLLRAAMIAEENAILFGQNSTGSATEQAPGIAGALATALSPTCADHGAAPVSNFANVSYDVFQTIITAMGESLPSAAATAVTPLLNHCIDITPVFPLTAGVLNQPILGFNFYIQITGGGGGAAIHKVLATDLVNNVSPSSGVLPSSSTTHVTWISNGDTITVDTIPLAAISVPVADNTASALSFNGIYPQMVGGLCPNIIIEPASALGIRTLTITSLVTLFEQMWNNSKADPDGIWCNARESVKITNLTIGSGTPYYVVVQDVAGATANYRVARLTNAVTGSEVPVKVHPTISQGTLLALSSKMPSWYVPTDIPTVWAMDLPQDYVEIDYPPTQATPYWQVEVRYFGALKLYLPVLQGAIVGINNL